MIKLQDYGAFLSKHYDGQEVLVTGGAGFIGSHIVDTLVEAGALVTVLDDFSTGTLSNLEMVKGRITIIKGSVVDAALCLEAARNKKCIFHLAASVSVQESIAKPLDCYHVNVTGTLNLLEAARHHKVDTFVFASSAAVYGNQKKACHERMRENPTSPYGFSKLTGERYCNYYAKQYAIKTIMLRYFNVHGHRQSTQNAYAGVVTLFKHRMAQGEPVTIFGDGSQRRDFVPIVFVVQATLLLALLPASRVAGTSVNVATGSSISVLELFLKLREQYPLYHLAPRYEEIRSGDIMISQADCSKYNRLVSLLGLRR
jgi:UDP-glucose 4-epimerase